MSWHVANGASGADNCSPADQAVYYDAMQLLFGGVRQTLSALWGDGE